MTSEQLLTQMCCYLVVTKKMHYMFSSHSLAFEHANIFLHFKLVSNEPGIGISQFSVTVAGTGDRQVSDPYIKLGACPFMCNMHTHRHDMTF